MAVKNAGVARGSGKGHERAGQGKPTRWSGGPGKGCEGRARRSDKSLDDLARMFNSIVQGWVNYYGRFYNSMLYPFLRRLNRHLVRWACREVQTVETPGTKGYLAGGGSQPGTGPVRALAIRIGQWEPDEPRGSSPVLMRARRCNPARLLTLSSGFSMRRMRGRDPRSGARPLRRPHRPGLDAYLGGSGKFEHAIADFAEVYADQNERDYAALQSARKDGRAEAATDI